MSSDDGPLSQELHAREMAKRAAGILRELQGVCQDPTQQSNPLPVAYLEALVNKLRLAQDLLAPDKDIEKIIEQLLLEFDAPEEMNIAVAQRNMISIRFIARSLEEKFNLTSGGGYSGDSLSVVRSLSWMVQDV